MTVVVAVVVLKAVDVAVLTDVVVAVLVTVAVLTDVVVAVLVTVAVEVTVEGGDVLVVDAPGALGENCTVYQVEMLFVIWLSDICVQPAGAGTPAGIGCAPPSNAAMAKL